MKCPNGHEISDNANFCPVCGVEIVRVNRYCSKCGTQLSDGAKFCPKCGQSTAGNVTNAVQKAESDSCSNEEPDEGQIKIWQMALLFVILCLGLTFCFRDILSSCSKESYKQVESIGSSYNDNEVEENDREEEEKRQQEKMEQEEQRKAAELQQEYYNKIMAHTSEITQIMAQINSIHNRCVAASIQNPNQVMGVNAVADISNLTDRGEHHFREMISIARETGHQDHINSYRQELEDFKRKSNQMQENILRLNDDMYQ